MISIKDAEEVLKKEYERDNYVVVLDDVLLPDFKKELHPVEFHNNLFENVTELGESKTCEVTVYEVILKEGAEKRRVAITQEMFRVLRGQAVNNAIVAFANADRRNYRFSLLTSKYEFDGNKVVKILSNPRRYSYSLGYGTKTKTAYKFLIEKGKVNSLEDLISRFSVEVVNKEFYKEIALSFTELIGGERDGKTFEKELNIYGVTDRNKYAEFAVRLIGRIMFCWFLKEKKSEENNPLIPVDVLAKDKISSSHNYYHDILEPLFFELLNTNQKRRKGKFMTEEVYKQIPYLNGGLFSPHTDDHYKYDTVNQSGQYGIITIPNEWFERFYDILSQYNFTVDENTAYDIELSIDPEMLGRIFENLLAEINPETGENAKKSTGSFYTPRDIVDYMVDNSILEYLKTKTEIDEVRLKALISYSKEDDDLAVFNNAEKEKIVNALYNVKVLDPACGSGAFPIGMLQKIVYMLQEIDPEANMWFAIINKNVPIYVRKDYEKKYTNGELNYIRKLTVIEKSIYGIDIQPIAVEIARLRCFLSLVIEQKVNDKEENRGVHPLPSLDFKFIIANSLIKLPDDSSISNGMKVCQGSLFENVNHIEELKRIREEYFNADSEDKARLREEFADVQKSMLQQTISMSKMATDRYTALFNWSPFKNEPTSWFDPEWMFGIKDGFDIVIGNPPYVSAVNDTMNDHTKLKQIYKELHGSFDLYSAFLCFAISKLNQKGVYCWIIPNKFLVAKYADKVKELLIQNGLEKSISLSHIEVFDNVGVYPIIIIGCKAKTNVYIEYSTDSLFTLALNQLKEANKVSGYTTFKDKGILFASGTTGFQAEQIKKYISEEKKLNSIPFLVSGCIDRYKIDCSSVRYMGNTYCNPYIEKGYEIADSKWNFWNNEKIIIAGMTKVIEATYLKTPMAMGVGAYAIYNYNRYLPEALVTILNSKFLTYYLRTNFNEKHLAGGYLAINKETLERLPLVDIPMEKQKELQYLYLRILDNDETAEEMINKLVYEIYGLTDEEIQLVEDLVK